jgi:GDPmannose 4,6-dehydratase
MSAKELGIALEWNGKAAQETAIDTRTGKVIVRVNPQLYRFAEVDLLIGDPTKAQQKLGWQPSVTFKELVALMVEADLQAVGCTSPNGNGGKQIQDIATTRQELGSLHF